MKRLIAFSLVLLLLVGCTDTNADLMGAYGRKFSDAKDQLQQGMSAIEGLVKDNG